MTDLKNELINLINEMNEDFLKKAIENELIFYIDDEGKINACYTIL